MAAVTSHCSLRAACPPSCISSAKLGAGPSHVQVASKRQHPAALASSSLASSSLQQQRQPRPTLRAAAAEGVASPTEAKSEAEAPSQLKEVLIESEVGQSYDVLQQRLAKGEWEAADQETRRLLCVLAGEGAAKRKWVYFTEVQYIPHKDLLTLDRLWRAYSDDRFGYSVQRRLWKAQERQWKPFFLKIEWTYGEYSTYKKFPLEFSWAADAPKGHLPLTSCLRGTQLFEKLLLHPAFAAFDNEQVMPEDSKLPDYSKGAPASENGAPAPPAVPAGPGPIGLTGSIFDEDFNSSDYGF